ncbi:MAG: cysteine hydrolase [Desulfuromonadales bacterium]|jgi:nicotinamidase/pyrazinamidase|nr:cysteine hydrolase [Desulfuromonadales bacterium]
MADALLIIDMLNDFVQPGAPLEVPQTRTIIKAIRGQISKARAAKRPVIYICDAHAPDDPEFSRMNWPAHAVRGTPGAEIITELAAEEMDPVIEKTGYSGFHQTGLEGLLQSLNIDHLTLTGCVTNICILFTAYDAVIRGYAVTVPADCVANLAAEDGAFALKQMSEVLGVKVEP